MKRYRRLVFIYYPQSSLQLLDTKTLDKQTTLLHFLVETIEASFPDLADFYDDLDGITAAARG